MARVARLQLLKELLPSNREAHLLLPDGKTFAGSGTQALKGHLLSELKK